MGDGRPLRQTGTVDRGSATSAVGTVLDVSMRRFTILLTVGLLAALAATPNAMAATAIGIGDQSAHMFTQQPFKDLKIKKVRYFIRWNAASNKGELNRADEYVAAARANGAKVLMHISTDDLRAKKAKLPSVAQYRSAVGKLVKRYKAKGVKEWGVWNEANHKTQPTYKSPKRAAEFFVAMRSLCKGCTIVALDVLDQAGSDRYIASWFKALGSRKSLVKVVGIHNYSDTNRFRSTGTAKILKAVKKYNKKTDFWLTETGGLAAFGGSFACNFTRQDKAVKYMFSLVKKYKNDITRLYSYNYFGTSQADCEARKFDAGLVDQNGTPRAAYTTFKKEAARYKR
jgi:hypothetical protein